MNIAYFDIETTGLASHNSFLVCAVVLIGDKRTVFQAVNYGGYTFEASAKMASAVVYKLAEAEVVCGHFVKKFDIPFLRGCLQSTEMPGWAHFGIATYDTWEAGKHVGPSTIINAIGKRVHSLEMLVDYYGIKQEKTKLYPRTLAAVTGGTPAERKAALKHVVDHCVADVDMTETLAMELLKRDPCPKITRERFA